MASSRSGSSVIHVEDSMEERPELQFQDFEHGDAATLETSDYNSGFPGSPDLDGENAGLLSEEKRPPSFWEFNYYQSFFDVDTDQVVRRIIWSMVPLKGRSTYLDRIVRPTPDLYGPFWIATTLIFSIAISANIAEYLMTEGRDKGIWQYDFHKVSLAATAIYSYVCLLPLCLWGLMWYRQSSTHYSLLEIVCVYGYSIFIYIPISVLWLIQIPWMQWTLVIIGASLSGIVLAHSFWPTVRDENRKIAVLALCLILLFHTLLAVGFVTYFFRPSKAARLYVVPVEETTTIKLMTDTSAIDIKPEVVSHDVKLNSHFVTVKLVPNGETSSGKNSVIKRKTSFKNFSAIVKTKDNFTLPDENNFTIDENNNKLMVNSLKKDQHKANLFRMEKSKVILSNNETFLSNNITV